MALLTVATLAPNETLLSLPWDAFHILDYLLMERESQIGAVFSGLREALAAKDVLTFSQLLKKSRQHTRRWRGR